MMTDPECCENKACPELEVCSQGRCVMDPAPDAFDHLTRVILHKAGVSKERIDKFLNLNQNQIQDDDTLFLQ